MNANNHLRAVFFALLIPGGCGPTIGEEQRYEPDPYPDQGSVTGQICQWKKSYEGPKAPDGTQAWPVAARIPVPDGLSSCEDIAPSSVDDVLLEEAESQCDKPIEDFLRGCYIFRDTDTEGLVCDFGAYYFSSCEVIIEYE